MFYAGSDFIRSEKIKLEIERWGRDDDPGLGSWAIIGEG